MPDLKFNGSSGRKPQTEARRYVYACLACMLDDNAEAIYGGIDNQFDQRRLAKAIAAVRKEMERKARA